MGQATQQPTTAEQISCQGNSVRITRINDRSTPFFWGLVWALFVAYIPTDLNHPWNVLQVVLGSMSPYLWLKTLNSSDQPWTSGEDHVDQSRNAPKRIALKPWMYLVVGIATWAFFVSNISPQFVGRPAEDLLRSFLGGTSPYFSLIALTLDRRARRQSTDQRRRSLNRIAWAFFILGVAAWVYFVVHLPFGLYSPWYEIHTFFCSVSGYAFVWRPVPDNPWGL